MRNTLAVAAAAWLLMLSPPAGADWKTLGSGGKSDIYMAMSATEGTEIFFGGLKLDMSSGFPSMSSLLFWSPDGGATRMPILGNLPGGGFSAGITALHFKDSFRGWAAIDKTLYRTTDRGLEWAPATLPKGPRAIHFFDADKGVAAGSGGMIVRSEDGGQSWTEVPSGTEADLACFFWVDDKRGFAAGHRVEEVGGGFDEEEKTEIHEGVVLATTDGGRSWTLEEVTRGKYLCPLFFLPDAKTGWLAAAAPGDNEGQFVAHLLRSDDGGRGFEDLGVDTQVGELVFMMKMPVHASSFPAMYWANKERGHLGGHAYVTSTSSSGGGGGGKSTVFRIVDFITNDGGKTFVKTDLGQMSMSLGPGGGNTPPSDGQVLSGVMSSLNTGWMVGEKGQVWVYERSCTSARDCGPREACGDGGTCEIAKPGAGNGNDAGGGTGSGGSQDAAGTLPGTDRGPLPDGAYPTGGPAGGSGSGTMLGGGGGGSSGCAAGGGSSPTPPGLVLLLSWLGWAHFRRREPHLR